MTTDAYIFAWFTRRVDARVISCIGHDSRYQSSKFSCLHKSLCSKFREFPLVVLTHT